MNRIIRFPRSLPKPLPERAVTRFYRLLDEGVVGQRDKTYGGQEAALAVAREFNVPATEVWRWVREHAEQHARPRLNRPEPRGRAVQHGVWK